MRERFGHDAAAPFPLQPVVADGAGRLHALLGVARFDQRARPVGVKRPDAREAVGLKLGRDGDPVGLHRRQARSAVADHVRDPEQVLDVVADLVRDDVGLREVSRRAEAVRQLAEEAEVQIDARVGRAIERADGGAGDPARRLHRLREQHQLGRFVRAARLLRHRCGPHVLGASEDDLHELGRLVLRGGRHPPGLGLGDLAAAAQQRSNHVLGRAQQRGDQGHDDRAPADRAAAAERYAAPIEDVVAPPTRLPPHPR